MKGITVASGLAFALAGCMGAAPDISAPAPAPTMAAAARQEAPAIRILVVRRNPDGSLSPENVFASATAEAGWPLACAVRRAMIEGRHFPGSGRRLPDGGELITILATPRNLPVDASMAGCKRAQLGRVD